MVSLKTIISDPDIILEMEPEELAGFLLQYFRIPGNSTNLHSGNIRLGHIVDGFPDEYHKKLKRVIMEAWMWLEREGFIALDPEQPHSEFYFITRRGERIDNPTDLEKYRAANILPKKFLHPIISEKIWPSFLRGEYGTAIFLSFKAVETEVRKNGNFESTDIGVDLMRKAFEKKRGPLTNTTLPVAEQIAVSHLFSGGIGFYKNPQSHREVKFEDPIEVMEIIIIASHLLRIIDQNKTS